MTFLKFIILVFCVAFSKKKFLNFHFSSSFISQAIKYAWIQSSHTYTQTHIHTHEYMRIHWNKTQIICISVFFSFSFPFSFFMFFLLNIYWYSYFFCPFHSFKTKCLLLEKVFLHFSWPIAIKSKKLVTWPRPLSEKQRKQENKAVPKLNTQGILWCRFYSIPRTCVNK